MRLLERARPNGGKLGVEVLAVEAHVLAGPGQSEEFLRLVDAAGLLLDAGPEAHVLERVVARSPRRPDDETAFGEIVEQRGLNGSLDGVVE